MSNKMDIKVAVVLALLVIGIFPVLTIYTYQAKLGECTEKESVDVALHFLRNTPTYHFDGITESVKIIEATKTGKPATWMVTIDFESRHSGYGDRTGQVLLQVITPHRIEVSVEECKVISATIDDMWDAMNQKKIGEDGDGYTEDSAIETALHFLYNGSTFKFDGIQESVKVVNVERLGTPSTWEITIDFECRHPGYGNRAGRMLPHVITPHQIKVVVREGEVVSAIIDNKWDEMA